MRVQTLAPGTRLDSAIVKSPNDKREYRVIVLENGLRVVLVSDMDASLTPTVGKVTGIGSSKATGSGKVTGSGNVAGAGRLASSHRYGGVGTEDSAASSDSENAMSVESDDDGGAGGTSGDDTSHSTSSSSGHRENVMAATHLAVKRGSVSLRGAAAATLAGGESHDGEKLAAAALCVGVGSFCDPQDIPGLAHFLEHMVFMGSEKYPDENAFDSFIKKHGGSGNAYTDCERTVFYFDIERKNFKEALDIFAQFFISPLMKKDSVDREVKAVDNEFDMSKPSDSCRKQQLLGSLAKAGHPMCKFMWGNEYTLKTQPHSRGIDIYERCREFHDRHYSAHYMTLAVQVKEKLDTIEEWIRSIFSAVPNNGLEQPSFIDCLDGFNTREFHKLYKVVPVKNSHTLELTWSLPCLRDHYRTKPLHYLGWLTGHEGAGSILSFFKKKLWALAVNSGNGESGWEQNSTGATFVVMVTITDHGLSKIYEIMTVIFEYLEMLRSIGPQKRIFEEIKIIEDNEFRWKEQVDPSEYVEHLAEAMQLFAPEDYLTGDSLMFEYNAEIIAECQRLLVPERCNAILLSKHHDESSDSGRHGKDGSKNGSISDCGGLLEEFWYGTRYTVSDFDPAWVKKWQHLSPREELHIPEGNSYIATDFLLRPLPATKIEHPVTLLSSQRVHLWFKPDTKFRVPRGYIYFHLMSPIVCANARSQATFDLFVELLTHNLQEVAYAAHVAQLEYEFKVHQTGLVIRLNGFNDKLSRLFETIVDHIADFTVGDELFHVVNEQMKKKYYNSFIKPEKLSRDLRLQLTQDSQWPQSDKRTMLITLHKEDLIAFVDEFRRLLFIEGYIHGNFLPEDALDIAHYISGRLNESILPPNMLPEERIVQLPKGERCCRVQSFNSCDTNSVVVNYYQMGPCNLHGFVLNELLTTVMDEPCFDVLRTREQLGYAVYCNSKNTFGIVGLIVSVSTQASKFSVRKVDDKIEAFLAEFGERLQNYKEEDFRHQVSSLIAIKQCDDSHMGEEADRYWVEIQDRTYLFDRLDCEIEEAETLTLQELRAWYQAMVVGRDRRKLSVQVVGVGENERGQRSPQRQPPYEVNTNPRSRSPSPIPDSTSLARGSFSATANASVDAKRAYEYHFLELEKDNQDAAITSPVEFKQSLMLYPVSKILKKPAAAAQ